MSMIEHTVHLTGEPRIVFEALVDGPQFAAVSGAPAESNATAGSAFSLFGGMIVGRQIEVVPDERIVQAWRVTASPAGVYSLARFDIHRTAEGSRLDFSHVGFPPEQREHLDAGWHARYWEPLKAFRAKMR